MEGAEGLPGFTVFSAGPVDQRLDLAPEHCVGRHAQDVAHVVSLKPVQHSRFRVVAVRAEDQHRVRKAPADAPHDALQQAEDLCIRRGLSRPHHRGNQSAGQPFVHVKRHQAVIVVVSFEQPHLLAAVHAVRRRVHVDDHAWRCRRIAVDKGVDDRVEQPQQVTPPDAVLQTAHGRL